MAETVPALQASQAAGLDAPGLADQQLEQQKLNQLALAAQTAYQLPTDRRAIANIYNTGTMPGSPIQKFATKPRYKYRWFYNMFRTLTPPPGHNSRIYNKILKRPCLWEANGILCSRNWYYIRYGCVQDQDYGGGTIKKVQTWEHDGNRTG